MVSYYIEADAHVMQIPHGNSRTNQKSYIRTCPSEVKKRLSNNKQEDAVLTDTANTSGNIVLQEADFEVGNEVSCSKYQAFPYLSKFLIFTYLGNKEDEN